VDLCPGRRLWDSKDTAKDKDRREEMLVYRTLTHIEVLWISRTEENRFKPKCLGLEVCPSTKLLAGQWDLPTVQVRPCDMYPDQDQDRGHLSQIPVRTVHSIRCDNLLRINFNQFNQILPPFTRTTHQVICLLHRQSNNRLRHLHKL
jgi:hypothetical protein